jgi:hypothetical protein
MNETESNTTSVNGTTGNTTNTVGTSPPSPTFPSSTMYPTGTLMGIDVTIAPWTDPKNQDKLSDTVALTRDFSGNIFNAFYGDINDSYAPYNTEWALLPKGKTFEEARCQLVFCDWYSCFAQYNPGRDMIGKPGIVHLIQEDEYYNIMFTNWTSDCYNYPYCGPYY